MDFCDVCCTVGHFPKKTFGTTSLPVLRCGRSALYRVDSIRLVLPHVIRENERLGPGPKITRKPASHALVWFGMRDTSPGQPAGRSRVVYTQSEIDGVIIYS